MKKLSLLIPMLLVLATTFAQAPYAIFNRDKPDLLKSVSVHSLWLGSTLTTAFNDHTDGLMDNVLLSGKIIYDVSVGGLKLPIVSNVNIDFGQGLSGFLNGDKGISIGVYPYKVIGSGAIETVLHGGLAYKLLPGATSFTPQETKIFAGVDFAKKVVESGYPVTLSLTPTYVMHNLDMKNFAAIESTLIVPISGALGLLAEYNTPFTKTVQSQFRAGIVITAPQK